LRRPELRHAAPISFSSSAATALVNSSGQPSYAPKLRWPQRAQQAEQIALFPGSSSVVFAPPVSAPQLVYCIEQDYNKTNTPKESHPVEVKRVARISRKGVLIYSRTTGGKGNPESLARGRAQLLEGGFPGSWSDKSKKKVRGIADAWLNSGAALRGDVWDQAVADLASKKFTLLTTTLCAAQAHTDQEVRRLMLMPFLKALKYKHPGLNYMWFAEKQGNGNIHFHLILDKFVKWEVARALWNKAQERHGYVERYRAARQAWHAGGFRYDVADLVRAGKEQRWVVRSEEEQRRAYEEGVRTNWSSPNGTDIRSAGGAAAVVGYVVEYCSKGAVGPAGSEKTKLDGRLWGCNRELAKLARYEVEVTPALDLWVRHNEESGTMQKQEDQDKRWVNYRGPVAELLAYELPALFQGYRAHWRAQGLTLPSRRGLRRAARQQAQKPPVLPRISSLSRARAVGNTSWPGSTAPGSSKSQSSTRCA